MGIFDKIFGKKEQKESLDQGLQKTKEGFFESLQKLLPVKVLLMKKCWTILKMP